MICGTRCEAVMAQHTYQRLLLHRPEFPKEISFLISEYVTLTAEDEEGIIQGFVQREWTRLTVTEPNADLFRRIRSFELFRFAMNGVKNPPSDNAAWFHVANERLDKIYPKSSKHTHIHEYTNDIPEVVTPFIALDAPRFSTRSLSTQFHPYQPLSWGQPQSEPHQGPITTHLWSYAGEMIFIYHDAPWRFEDEKMVMTQTGQKLAEFLPPASDPKIGEKLVLAPFTLQSEGNDTVYCGIEIHVNGTTLFFDLDGIRYTEGHHDNTAKLFVLPIAKELVDSTGSPNDIVDWNFSFAIQSYYFDKTSESELLAHRIASNGRCVQDTYSIKYKRTASPEAIKEANTAAAKKDKK